MRSVVRSGGLLRAAAASGVELIGDAPWKEWEQRHSTPFQNFILEVHSILRQPMSNADIRRVLERAEPGPRKAHKRRVMACALDCFEASGVEAATIEDIRARA